MDLDDIVFVCVMLGAILRVILIHNRLSKLQATCEHAMVQVRNSLNPNNGSIAQFIEEHEAIYRQVNSEFDVISRLFHTVTVQLEKIPENTKGLEHWVSEVAASQSLLIHHCIDWCERLPDDAISLSLQKTIKKEKQRYIQLVFWSQEHNESAQHFNRCRQSFPYLLFAEKLGYLDDIEMITGQLATYSEKQEKVFDQLG